MGLEFSITIDSAAFKAYTGIKINYSKTDIENSKFNIQNHGLLFENQITAQDIDCFETIGYKAFFKTAHSDFAFDIFAASFYLLSRYEEYLPHQKDFYGRYAHENSLAFKERFIRLPLINIWVRDFGKALSNKYSMCKVQGAMFKFVPTYDIDMAYSYKFKGLWRNIAGFIRSPSFERIKVLAGFKKDPYDAYLYLDILHKKYHLNPVYFFLVADKHGRYDKNISPHKSAMWKLVKQNTLKYQAGLHPSWLSGENTALLKKEKEQLEAMSDIGQAKITSTRQHYIRFNLPVTYRRLSEAGITDEFSMGYGSVNGFRASVASSFYWYDLERNIPSTLRIHPFCFMDANSFYEQRFSAKEAYDELMHYFRICKEVNGTLITIWHNNFLGTDKAYAGWKDIYELFISQLDS